MTAVLDDDLGWLLGTPVSDLNFTVALHRADVEVLEQARRDLDGQDGVKTKLAQLDRELEFRRMLTHDPTERLEAVRDRLAAKPGNVEHLAKLQAELDRRHQVAATGNAGAGAEASEGPGLARAGRPLVADDPVMDGWAMLDPDEIVPAPDNPRRHLGDLTELTASLQAHGILEPLLVTPTVPPTDCYLLVCGSRRLAAAREAGLDRVPAVIRELTEPERVAAMLVENVQRSNLTALEEASAYARLLEVDPDATQRDIAKLTGVNQSTIARRLALLELPTEALDALDAGCINLGQATELHKLVDAGIPDRAAELARQQAAGELQHWQPIERLVGEDLERLRIQQRTDQVLAELEAQGARVLQEPKNGWHSKAPRPLGDQEHARCVLYHEHVKIPVADHQALGCHAAAVCKHGEEVWMCRDPKRHATEPARDPWEIKREREEAERRLRERALNAAARVRVERCRALLAPDVLAAYQPAQQVDDVLSTLLARLEANVAKAACKLLELDPVEESQSYGGTYKNYRRALEQLAEDAATRGRVARAVVLAHAEEHLRIGWGRWTGRVADRHLATLQAAGYELSDAEQAKLEADRAEAQARPGPDDEDADAEASAEDGETHE